MPHVIGSVDEVLERRLSESAENNIGFGDIAPLHVYHGAAVAFLNQAKEAFARLRKADHPHVREREDHDDYGTCNETLDPYNAAFLQVLSDNGAGGWPVEIDETGCYRVVVPKTDERRFGGDAPGSFAFYADEESLAAEVTRMLSARAPTP